MPTIDTEPGEWDALGLDMCSNCRDRCGILADCVDCERVSSGSQRKIKTVAKSAVNVVQTVHCTALRVTIYIV